MKTENSEKAEILQHQFSSVFTNEPEGDLPYFQPRCNKTIDQITITEADVRKEIKNLDKNKSPGPDGIHPRLLKELVDLVYKSIASIMNMSMTNGCLPGDWKTAHFTPIYKHKGDKNQAVNYRPISLTSIVCKMMESILLNHTMHFLLEEKLISPFEHAFNSKRSTTTQLLNFVDKCCESMAVGKVVGCIYFDFVKVF